MIILCISCDGNHIERDVGSYEWQLELAYDV